MASAGFRTFGERARNTPITHATDVVFPYVQLVCGSNARLKTPVTPLLSVLWAFHWKCQKTCFSRASPPGNCKRPFQNAKKHFLVRGFPGIGRGGGAVGASGGLRASGRPRPPPRPHRGRFQENPEQECVFRILEGANPYVVWLWATHRSFQRRHSSPQTRRSSFAVSLKTQSAGRGRGAR